MRVLHLLTTLDRGGAEAQVAALCRALAARGRVEPSVAYLKGNGELAADLLASGIPVAEAGRNPWRLAALIRERRPEVLHTHLFQADLLGAALARRSGVPALVSTKHNEDLYLREPLWNRLGRAAAGRAGRVVAISGAVEGFVRETLGLADGRVRVIRYGLDPARLPRGDGAAFRAAMGVAADAPLAVAVARLSRQKGLDLLVEAAKSLRSSDPAARVVLVGRGEEERALRDLVRARGLGGTVLFAGFLADPGPAFAAADVVVLPSRWEGFGLAALEAMAAGRPVVAAAVGGLPEVLGDTGTLVPPGDAKALAEALRQALSPERVGAVRSGAAAGPLRLRALGEFSLERAAVEHETLYGELLGRAVGAAPARRRAARVLIVARAGTGGAARHVRLLVEHLDRMRFEPTVAVSPLEDPAFPGRLEALGARVVEVPMERDPAPLRDLAAFHAVRTLVRSGEFDLVHAHTSKPGAFARLAAGASGVPVLYTPHGWFFEYAPSAAARALYLRVERTLGARGGLVHCVSDAEGDAAVREGVAPRERIRVVPNGVPAAPTPNLPRLEALRHEFGLAPDEQVALMAARLAEPKDPLTFLAVGRALAASTGTRFLLAGSGPLLEECRAAAGPGVLVLGERADVADLLALCDLAVLTTRYDACPYFALEAAAAGKPIVTPSSAIPRALLPGADPYDPADPASLATVLAGLLAHGARDLRTALGVAAKDAWSRELTPDRWIARMEAMYEGALRG
jgi:glycosyltransferase involved in cell wall biosynthesis